jgi:hypothetical protein
MRFAQIPPTVKRMKTMVLTIAVLLALAGCGQSDGGSDRVLVERTIEQYFHAAAFGDGATACQFLTDQARHGFRALLDGPVARGCEANIRKVARTSLPLHFMHVNQIVIDDDRATAYVTSERPPYSNSVVLSREDDSWKLLYLPVEIRRVQPRRIAAREHH